MKIDWKNILKVAAPTIATALGGPLAGVAVNALSQAVLGKSDGTEEELAAVVATGNPDILLKLKEAENSFTTRMRELDIEVDKVNAGDRDSARKREAAVGDKTARNLAYLYTLGYFTVLGLVAKLGIPIEAKDVFNALIGILSAAQIGIVQYYFGSSAGSAAKNSMFDKLIK